ncbi:MAG: hypothetical protein RL701_1076 [Pseudomonadota bacterium]
MKSNLTINLSPWHSLDELFQAVLDGKLGPAPSELIATSAFWLCHTTRLAGSSATYLNHYVLLRSGGSFGAASFALGDVDTSYCAKTSGLSLADIMRGEAPLPVRVAALDAYLAETTPHRATSGAEVVALPAGRPEEKARARDNAIAELLELRAGQRVALIGVVNPLIAAIEARGGRCLPCDFNLRVTNWNQPVAHAMEEVLAKADAVVATGMTLANGTFNRILAHCRTLRLPLVIYAQTGSAIARSFLGSGVTALCAEPFPFSQFSADQTMLYRYRAAAERAYETAGQTHEPVGIGS